MNTNQRTGSTITVSTLIITFVRVNYRSNDLKARWKHGRIWNGRSFKWNVVLSLKNRALIKGNVVLRDGIPLRNLAESKNWEITWMSNDTEHFENKESLIIQACPRYEKFIYIINKYSLSWVLQYSSSKLSAREMHIIYNKWQFLLQMDDAIHSRMTSRMAWASILPCRASLLVRLYLLCVIFKDRQI